MDADHDHILCFSKSKERCALKLLERSESMNARYKNPDNDPRGPWTSDNPLRREYREYAFYEIITPAGRKVTPPLVQAGDSAKRMY
jgi:adenine-specific DNA-methyltransferase